jgi:hypothetical protein
VSGAGFIPLIVDLGEGKEGPGGTLDLRPDDRLLLWDLKSLPRSDWLGSRIVREFNVSNNREGVCNVVWVHGTCQLILEEGTIKL